MGGTTVQTAYDKWSNPTEQEIKEDDPLQLLPRIMAAYSVAQGDLLRVLSHNVTVITGEISNISGFMDLLNSGMGALKNQTADTDYKPKYFASLAEANAEKQKWIDIGAQPEGDDFNTGWVVRTDTSTPAGAAGPYCLLGRSAGVESMQKRLQNRVNDFTTANQQAQLVLQTIMGRYNSTFDVLSNAIKKNSTQLEAIMNNFRR